MEIKKELDLREFEAWSGAKSNLKRIIELDKVEEVEEYLQEMFYSEVPTETQVNDVLWFEIDYILDLLGLTQEEFYR